MFGVVWFSYITYGYITFC